MNKGEILIYQTSDGATALDVRFEQETIWLTQQQIADLFGTKRQAITKHLKNIFISGELVENSVRSILEHTASKAVHFSVTKKISRSMVQSGRFIKHLAVRISTRV